MSWDDIKRVYEKFCYLLFVNRNMRISLKLQVVTQTCGRIWAVVTLCLACTKKQTKWLRKVGDNAALLAYIL